MSRTIAVPDARRDEKKKLNRKQSKKKEVSRL
jgi:hypothetical protein